MKSRLIKKRKNIYKSQIFFKKNQYIWMYSDGEPVFFVKDPYSDLSKANDPIQCREIDGIISREEAIAYNPSIKKFIDNRYYGKIK